MRVGHLEGEGWSSVGVRVGHQWGDGFFHLWG